ncbi:hypothetical protein H4Q26_008409 [Puccinia striiformis f. sp. tritici PST-130]|uniref:Uncharacterized protein n=4 Tax=Puccinia striiformis TaxID=27350 RepID=A0A0L0VR29_9BASI|nr:hypothetical protein H4Q26_008409 [Puccinia striiformis f. sp. tritici PST-130]KNF01738.1 hypothetical protein PSTG_05165 [Puccinia striiformis f. sp. tritici PST-78]
MRASATRRTIWISMVEVTSQQALFDRLQSNLLPILAQQLAILSDRLDPSALQKEPSSKLKCILELQAALEITLDQIATTLTTIVERNRTQSARGQRTNDQHNTELIRVDGLENYLTGRMFVRMRRVFEESDELIQQLRLSKKQCNHRFDVASIRERLVLNSSSAQGELKRTIKWFTGSQLDRVQDHWPSKLRRIDQILHDLLIRTQVSSNRKQEDRLTGTAEQSSVSPLGDPAIQLVKSLIPVIKLSKLFFKSFSQRGINRKRLISFTPMSFEKLEQVASAAGDFVGNLSEIQQLLTHETSLRRSSYFLIAKTKSLQLRLGSAYCCTVSYFVPLIPDTDGFPTQNLFKAWYEDWYTAFKLTTQNFIKTIKIAC